MGKQSKATVALSLRISPQVRDAAAAAAKADRRTISGLTTKLLIDYLEQHGFLPQAKGQP
jgi:hypothetical protein